MVDDMTCICFGCKNHNHCRKNGYDKDRVEDEYTNTISCPKHERR